MPIQKQPAVRPVAAPRKAAATPAATNGVKSAASEQLRDRRPRKKVKQAAGATTALLAIFSFLVFLSPVSLPWSGSGAALQQLGGDHRMSVQQPLSRAGRVLTSVSDNHIMALPAGVNDSSHSNMSTQAGPYSEALAAWQAKNVSAGHALRTGSLEQHAWPNGEPTKAIVLRHSDSRTEAIALQQLKVCCNPRLLFVVKL